MLLHKSTTSLSFPPTLRCWSLYLVKKSILPESEHHHVRPVSSPEGSKKVLNGKRWREKSVQKRPNKGMKRHSCLDHFPETAHRETEQGTQHCCSAPGHRLKSMETSWRGWVPLNPQSWSQHRNSSPSCVLLHNPHLLLPPCPHTSYVSSRLSSSPRSAEALHPTLLH